MNGVIFRTLIGGAITIILNIIVIKGKVPIPDTKTIKNVIYALFIISFALSVINYFISAIFRRAIWRIIPCCNRDGAPVFVTQLIKHLIIFSLTVAYSFLLILEPNSVNLILHYRAFNRLFHAPYAASFESAILFLILIGTDSQPSMVDAPNFLILFIIHWTLHRVMIFSNKCLYVLVSLTTAYKNTKQRFASQTICFVLQFTILLPFYLFVIFFTAVFNTATVPFLGFAYFIAGYPKPQRGWSALIPAQANPNDSRSDGHLY